MNQDTRLMIMYFLYKNNPYAINCDWLQYSVNLYRIDPTISCPPTYRVELCQGNNVFEKRALVFDKNGRKTLTLLWQPYSSVLNPMLMTVQVANEGLYSGNILSSLELTKQIVECQFNSIGRFDVCCDFTMTDKRFETVKHLNSGHYYVERKAEGSNFWHEEKVGDHKHKVTHCISWGSKHSEIKVKLYNKTRELGMDNGGQPEKPWIVKEWETIGIDKQHAWRLEFSLTSNGQLRYNDDQIFLSNIASPSWLMRVYFDLYFSRFVTRINQGRKKGHHNDDKRVFIIPLPSDGEKIAWKATTTNNTESLPAIKLLRSMLHQLENEALVADKPLFKTYTDTILDVVTTHHLEEYFERSFCVNAHDYLNSLSTNAGEGVNIQNVSISKLID